jgi:hypothetical protein
MIDPFNNHGVMVGTAEYVAVDLEEVQSFAANAKELAVFIQHNIVAEAIPKDDLHYCRGRCGSISIADGFYCAKAAMR